MNPQVTIADLPDDRKVFYIDVGNMDPEEVITLLQQIKSEIKMKIRNKNESQES